jgi:hypothetical protein
MFGSVSVRVSVSLRDAKARGWGGERGEIERDSQRERERMCLFKKLLFLSVIRTSTNQSISLLLIFSVY